MRKVLLFIFKMNCERIGGFIVFVIESGVMNIGWVNIKCVIWFMFSCCNWFDIYVVSEGWWGLSYSFVGSCCCFVNG